MSDPAPSHSGLWPTVCAVAGVFAIFAIILSVAYLPQTPAPLTEGARTPEQRKTILLEHRAKETRAINSYGWIDQPKGIVRLPIDRAVELTIQDLNAKK